MARRWIELDRSEARRVIPLALANGVVLASLYVLKPARTALFLDLLGVDQLPYALLLVAMIGGVVTGALGRLAVRVSIDRMITRTYAVLIASIALFRLILTAGTGPAVYAFFVFVSLYGLIATSLIWLYANAVFHPREARRVFGWIGGGGIAGAIIGGLATGRIAPWIGTENLLLACAGLLVVALLLIRLVPIPEQRTRRASDEAPADGTVWSAINSSNLLRRTAAMTALIALVTVVVDIQFNAMVGVQYPSKDAKTAFFGNFFGWLNAFAFVFQIVFTSRILKSLGSVPALALLPFGLATGTIAFLVSPNLISVMLGKIGDGAFRHSIHKSATEILYLPVPGEVKKRTKVFLDATLDAVASGGGALLIVLMTKGFGFDYPALGAISLVALAAWTALALGLKRDYVNAFRKAIERREIDLRDLRTNVAEAAALGHLINALAGNERGAAYALDMLAGVESPQLAPAIIPLLDHSSRDVRKKALALARKNPGDALLAKIEALVRDDPELEVKSEAIAVLAHHGRAKLEAWLDDPDPAIRAATVRAIADGGVPEAKALLHDARIASLLGQTESVRVQVVLAIGSLAELRHLELLTELSKDPAPAIITATIDAAGRSRDPRFVPWLLLQLESRDRRANARTALINHGRAVIDTLRARLLDEATENKRVRLHIPSVLSEIADRASVDALLDALDASDSVLRPRILKALTRLRTGYPELGYDRARTNRAIEREAMRYHQLLQIARALAGSTGRAALLLQSTIEAKESTREHIFRLLALRYRPSDVSNAYLSLVSGQPALAGTALELLDNILRSRNRALLLPLLDPSAEEEAIRRGRELFATEPIDDVQTAIAAAGRIDRPWLRACAIYAAPSDARARETASKDPHPLVRETLAYVEREAAA